MKLKVIAFTSKSVISVLESITSNIKGEGVDQFVFFDKDYNLVNPKLHIASPIYNGDMLSVFSKLLVNAPSQRRMIIIDTSNSIVSVQQDIIDDLFNFIRAEYPFMLSDALSRLWVYAGPSLSSVDPITGKLVLSDDYGKDTFLSQSTVTIIKNTVENILNKVDCDTASLLSFRDFIEKKSGGLKSPFVKSTNGYKWEVPLDINGHIDYPFSLHLRTDPNDTKKIMQITLKQMINKETNDNFSSPLMPNGLRSWIIAQLNDVLGDTLQIVEGGKTSINFNAYGFETKTSAINDVYARFGLKPNEKEVIYVGDEARILPDNHAGNDSIVFSLPYISLVNTGVLNDGSKSLEDVILSNYGLSKGIGSTLFNLNVSKRLNSLSAVHVARDFISSFLL